MEILQANLKRLFEEIQIQLTGQKDVLLEFSTGD